MREVAPGQATAAVYLTVTNTGDGSDRLVEVTAPVAATAALHSSSHSGGVARMRAIEDGVDVPARSTVELKPGGTHIMLNGLKEPPRPGETFGMSLRFARSGHRSVAVRVVPATADSAHGMAM